MTKSNPSISFVIEPFNHKSKYLDIVSETSFQSNCFYNVTKWIEFLKYFQCEKIQSQTRKIRSNKLLWKIAFSWVLISSHSVFCLNKTTLISVWHERRLFQHFEFVKCHIKWWMFNDFQSGIGCHSTNVAFDFTWHTLTISPRKH